MGYHGLPSETVRKWGKVAEMMLSGGGDDSRNSGRMLKSTGRGRGTPPRNPQKCKPRPRSSFRHLKVVLVGNK